ncbi:unnamed protein product [Cyclocybe aegerita]|uniref:GPI-anchored wall transfer protein 1 n=1 Tax=Cyclocybe aegerita TaxID=1973307 RepID=A0A8S0VV87_CYCAE|nr:unnamed protein product [Cyclocybe aegerita]
MATTELAATYAALILADDGIEITSDKIIALTNAAGVELEPIWASLLAKALEGKNVKELLSNVGSGGGAPAAGAPAAAAGGAAAAEAPKEEEKEEEKEESDDDMRARIPHAMADDYKAAKEAFVSGMTGSSIAHVNCVSLIALIGVALYAAIRTRIAPTRNIGFLASWTILVLPMLLSMTLSAIQPIYLNLVLLVLTIGLLLLPRPESGTPLPSRQPASPLVETRFPQNRIGGARIPALPALTTYRAHMMLMTVLAILAVDFPVFPRSLAKCETYGVSLMDLGVGSFVFSQGVVSAIPLVKDPYYLGSPILPKLKSVTMKCLPIIALGLVRVILVKGTEYPEHATEYGVHWNFFITLAILPILQVVLHPIFRHVSISMTGVLVALMQQTSLSKFGMKDYVLLAPRTSLVSANKEGIVSLTGYLAIQLLGLSVGTLVLPPSPNLFSQRQRAPSSNDNKERKRRDSNTSSKEFDLSAPRQLGKTAIELCAYSIVWWMALGATKFVGIGGNWGKGGGGVSRQMVNLPYILWVVAFNTSFLLSYIVVLDIGIFGESKGKSAKAKHRQITSPKKGQLRDPKATSPGSSAPPFSPFSPISPSTSPAYLSVPSPSLNLAATSIGNPPKLLEMINKHGLIIFLLANIFTGLINLSVKTMYVKDGWAMVILSGYSILVCAVPWFAGSWLEFGAWARSKSL